jgi:glutathione S-transferase
VYDPGMKLYNANLSPYASRVRIAIYAKNLPIEIVAPPGGLGSAEYKKISPLGKVPALEVDGRLVVESEVINEFLEDRFPTPALRPADPLARAHMRLLSRFADLYLSPSLTVIFGQMNPATRDAKLVGEKLAELGTRLDELESLVVAGPYAAGSSLSLADCTLAPLFFFLTRLVPAVGGKNPLEGRPKLAQVCETLGKHPAVVKVTEEQTAAMVERLKGG